MVNDPPRRNGAPGNLGPPGQKTTLLDDDGKAAEFAAEDAERPDHSVSLDLGVAHSSQDSSKEGRSPGAFDEGQQNERIFPARSASQTYRFSDPTARRGSLTEVRDYGSTLSPPQSAKRREDTDVFAPSFGKAADTPLHRRQETVDGPLDISVPPRIFDNESDAPDPRQQTLRETAEEQRSRTERMEEETKRSDIGVTKPISAQKSEDDNHHVTVQFQHVETEQGHMILTGRANEIMKCEDEPIHIPGAIQSYGALIALQASGDALVVRQCSESCNDILGLSPKFLLGMENFYDIFPKEEVEILKDQVAMIHEDSMEADAEARRDEGRNTDATNPNPEVFLITGYDETRSKTWTAWAAINMDKNNGGLVLLELELEVDRINPLTPSSTESSADSDESAGVRPMNPEIIEESTVSASRPLRRMRKHNSRSSGMEIFSILGQINSQLMAANDLKTFLKTVVGIVKEITAYHRVMIYQFDESYNGQVVAELVDWRASQDLFYGLHFPMTDIPPQARELYKKNKVRLLYDCMQPTSRLVCKTKKDLDSPIDMTHSFLRAMSPIHIKYLKNMNVRSSMSISITAFDQLWGLIACHSYGSSPSRPNFIVRKLCRILSETVSQNIERLSYAQRLSGRRLINTSLKNGSASAGFIVTKAEDLLQLFAADFGILHIGIDSKLMGKPPSLQEVVTLREFFKDLQFDSITPCQDVHADFPNNQYTSSLQHVSGFLFIPLSAYSSDYIVFMRNRQVKQVNWAGNPYEKVLEYENKPLAPRNSFRVWSETVFGKCKSWSENDIETATVLNLIYGKFIEVWRQKQTALHNSKLTNLLLSNASHEIRTPLNAVINYLEIAMEGNLDPETLKSLKASHAASKSLVYVINDMLDMTHAEAGQALLKDEKFSLREVVNEVVQWQRPVTKRKNLQIDLTIDEDFPEMVSGDVARTRQILSNVLSNAVQYTEEGSIDVSCRCQEITEDDFKLEIEIADTGPGIEESKLDRMFQAFEEIEPFSEENEDPQGGLGLGLAIVARVVKNMNATLKASSQVNKGSVFTFCFCFARLPGTTEPSSPKRTSKPPGGVPSNPPEPKQKAQTEPKVSESEPKSALSSSHSLSHSSRHGSSESLRTHSSNSEIDQIVEDIGTPLYGSTSENVALAKQQGIKSADKTGPKVHSVGSTSASKSRSTPSGSNTKSASPQKLRAIKMDDFDVTEDAWNRHQFKESTPMSRTGSVSDSSVSSSSNATVRGKSRTSPTGDKKWPLKILVAEDDPINRKIMKKRLEMEDHEISFAYNGLDCVDFWKKEFQKNQPFDAILMDLQMPLCDGYQAAQQIRQLEKDIIQDKPDKISRDLGFAYRSFGRIPIIAVSASVDENRRQDLISAGMDSWCLKPVDFSHLRSTFHGISDREQREKDLYKEGQTVWEKGGWLFMDAPPST